MSLPMILTVSRLFIVPLFVVFMLLPFTWAMFGAFVLFISAAITDFLDGFLARQMNQTSKIGALLDPVADKILTISAIVMLIFEKQLSIFGLFAGLLIIWREIGVMTLRQAMANHGEEVTVSWLAKLKTTIQFLALSVLLLPVARTDTTVNIIGEVLLVASAILTVHSFYQYVKKSLPILTANDDISIDSL